jgi:imidazolonepropionase-like amidohydrolase
VKDGDVLVREGCIVEVGRSLHAPKAHIIDAVGKIVLPGLIDGSSDVVRDVRGL